MRRRRRTLPWKPGRAFRLADPAGGGVLGLATEVLGRLPSASALDSGAAAAQRADATTG